MSNLAIAPPGPDAAGQDGRSPSRREAPRQPALHDGAETPAAADCGQRLIIQEDGDTGRLLYIVIDRASGQVVAQAPREEVARMSQRSDYAAGALVRARA